MIKFKEESSKAEFQKLAPRLKQLVGFIHDYAQIFHGEDIVITDIFRNDASTHNQKPPFRFIDIRIIKDLETSEKLRQFINKIFPYGLNSKGKPAETIVPLDHSATSPEFTAPHLHVQVSSRKDFG